MDYPLYELLLSRVNASNKPLDIARACSTITTISQTGSAAASAEHYREIAALIIHHYFRENRKIPTVIPYNPRILGDGKGALFTITSLPPALQRIIAEYLEYSK